MHNQALQATPRSHVIINWTTLTQAGQSDSLSCIHCLEPGMLSQLRALDQKTRELRSYGATMFRHVCASGWKSLMEKERIKWTSGAHRDTPRGERGSIRQTGHWADSWDLLGLFSVACETGPHLSSTRYLHPSNKFSFHCLLSYSVVFAWNCNQKIDSQSEALCTSDCKTSSNQRVVIARQVPPFQNLHRLNKPHFTLTVPSNSCLDSHPLSPSLP